MTTPPFLMGMAMMFWGWQNGFLMTGVLMGALLEGSRLVPTRWELSDMDVNRIADLCWVLFATTALMLYSTQERLLFIFKLAEWLPVCFLPLIMAQVYGNRPALKVSSFWWLWRRSKNSPMTARTCNISYGYYALCLLGASASTKANNFFFVGIALFFILALAVFRSRRVSLPKWIFLAALAVAAGEFSQQGLRQMQNAMETALGSWISDLIGSQPDAREMQTQIGHAGQISLSGKIVLRVRAEGSSYVPSLLRESVWDAYKNKVWMTSNSDFSMTQSGSSDTARLFPTNALSSEIEVSRYYPNGSGILDLPQGAEELRQVPALVKTNRMGVVALESGPGLMSVRVLYGPGHSLDCPPTDRDLIVPEAEIPVLQSMLDKMHLKGLNNRQKVRAIEKFFSSNFVYSLNIPSYRETNGVTALGHFLLKTHRGHCEYFATATVLLLRQAGVRARYATGYAIQPEERHGDTFLVRSRDAHAWTLAYHDDNHTWEQVDTTPGNRDMARLARLPWWQPASDAISDFYYQFSKWRWNKTSYARWSVWLLVPLILYLLGRILYGRRRQKSALAADAMLSSESWPGLDSELFLLNHKMAGTDLARHPNEPLAQWQLRLEDAFPDSTRLSRIFFLHRRLRFDPQGLAKTDRDTLREEAVAWLAELSETSTATASQPA